MGLFGGSSPAVFSPAPGPLMLVGFSPVTPIGVPLLVAIGVLLWCSPLWRGDGHVPRRTILLAWLVGLGSIAWFVTAAIRRLLSGDPLYTAVMVTMSVLLAVTTGHTLRLARHRPTLRASALAHLSLFVWLVSYAYPWFGEVI